MIQLQDEVTREGQLLARLNSRLKSLSSICNTHSKGSKFSLVRTLSHHFSEPNCLTAEYERVCRRLNQICLREKTVTASEKAFREFLSLKTKVKFYSQVWIGNFCVDLFTPALGIKASLERGRIFTAKGVVIEVDGPIHCKHLKARKDAYKEVSLSQLGIVVWRVENNQVLSGSGLPQKHDIATAFSRTCSRERVRIWKAIQLLTILYHSSDDDLANLICQSVKQPKRRKTT